VQELKESLTGLSGILDELLLLSRDKTRLLVENKVDEIVALTSKELKAVARMDAQYGAVEKATAACLAEMGFHALTTGTLANLIKIIPRFDEKKALNDIALDLKEKHDELKERNNRNQLLARQSLDYIGYELDLISAPLQTEVTYSPSAIQQSYGENSYRRMFDTKA
jgi:FlgN protein.